MKEVGRHAACCVVIFGLILFLAGCGGEGGQAILDLVPLEMDLVAEYGVAGVGVGLQDGTTLGVTLTDGASGSPASEQRAERARAVAEFVCQHYRSIDRFDTVEVAFEIRRGGFLSDESRSVTFCFRGGGARVWWELMRTGRPQSTPTCRSSGWAVWVFQGLAE